MPRNNSDFHRPSSTSNPHHRNNNNRFSSQPINHSNNHPRTSRHPPPSIWEPQDDLIAPTHSSTSIPALQRWAHATASFPQSGLGRREHVIVERIERRYGAGRQLGMSDGKNRDEGSKKRRRSVEGEGDGGGKRVRRGEVVDLTGEEEGEREGEKEGKGGFIDLTGDGEEEDGGGDVDYAQSSEWSWAGSQEDMEERG